MKRIKDFVDKIRECVDKKKKIEKNMFQNIDHRRSAFFTISFFEIIFFKHLLK